MIMLGIWAGIGLIFGILHKYSNMPNIVEISQNIRKPITLFLILIYFIAGILIVISIFKPKTIKQWITSILTGIVWDLA